MGLDVGSKVNIKSIAGLEHLQAIPANNGPINDSGGYRDVVQLLPNESFVKLHDRRTGVGVGRSGSGYFVQQIGNSYSHPNVSVYLDSTRMTNDEGSPR